MEKSKILNLKDKTIFFYSISIVFIVAMSYISKNIDISHLKFLLYPVSKFIEMYFNIELFFIDGLGYGDINNSFIIGKSCLGLNFFILLIGIFIPKLIAQKNKLKSSLLFIIAAYFITIITNFIRISSSIYFLGFNFEKEKFLFIHSSIGIITYLTSLIISFYFISKILKEGELKNENEIVS